LAPENRPQKQTILFQPLIFRGKNVSFREDISPVHLLRQQGIQCARGRTGLLKVSWAESDHQKQGKLIILVEPPQEGNHKKKQVCKGGCFVLCLSSWWLVSTHLKNMLVKLGIILSGIGVKIKNILKPPPSCIVAYITATTTAPKFHSEVTPEKRMAKEEIFRLPFGKANLF